MSQLRVVMTGEEAQLFNALQNVIAQSKKADDAFESNQSSSGEAEKAAIAAAKAQAKAAREGARLADRLAKKNETLEESYKRREAQIEAAGKAGIKSEEEVRKAISQLRQDVDAQAQAEADAALKSTQAYRDKQAQIQRGVEKVGQLKRANQSLESQYRELKASIKAAFDAGKIEADEYERSIEELTREYDQLNRKQETFSSAAISNVEAYAASFLSVASIIQIIREGLQLLKQDQENALNIGGNLEESRRNLRGLSRDFAELERAADKISLATGLERTKSRDIVFTGTSQGLSDSDVGLVAQLDPVVAAEVGIKFAADLRQQFEKENLTGEQALNTALTAADVSKFNAREILPQIQKASIGAAVHGASSSDTAALVAVLGAKLGESTGTGISGMFSQFATSETFQGLDGIASVEKFSSLSKEEQADFTNGNKQVIGVLKLAVDSLNQLKRVDQGLEESQRNSGTDKSAVRQEISQAFDLNTKEGLLLRSQRDLAIAKVKDELSLENTAITAATRKQIYLESNTRLRNEDSGLLGGVARAVENTALWSGFLMEDIGIPTSVRTRNSIDELLDESRKQTELMRQEKSSSEPLSIPTEDK